MTLIIIDDCTHNKTFSVYGKPNGAVKKLLSSSYHLNPRVHAEPLISQTDGSHDFSDNSSPPLKVGLKVREPSGIFGKDLVMD